MRKHSVQKQLLTVEYVYCRLTAATAPGAVDEVNQLSNQLSINPTGAAVHIRQDVDELQLLRGIQQLQTHWNPRTSLATAGKPCSAMSHAPDCCCCGRAG
jgi:hypothetical protein